MPHRSTGYLQQHHKVLYSTLKAERDAFAEFRRRGILVVPSFGRAAYAGAFVHPTALRPQLAPDTDPARILKWARNQKDEIFIPFKVVRIGIDPMHPTRLPAHFQLRDEDFEPASLVVVTYYDKPKRLDLVPSRMPCRGPVVNMVINKEGDTEPLAWWNLPRHWNGRSSLQKIANYFHQAENPTSPQKIIRLLSGGIALEDCLISPLITVSPTPDGLSTITQYHPLRAITVFWDAIDREEGASFHLSPYNPFFVAFYIKLDDCLIDGRSETRMLRIKYDASSDDEQKSDPFLVIKPWHFIVAPLMGHGVKINITARHLGSIPVDGEPDEDNKVPCTAFTGPRVVKNMLKWMRLEAGKAIVAADQAVDKCTALAKGKGVEIENTLIVENRVRTLKNDPDCDFCHPRDGTFGRRARFQDLY